MTSWNGIRFMLLGRRSLVESQNQKWVARKHYYDQKANCCWGRKLPFVNASDWPHIPKFLGFGRQAYVGTRRSRRLRDWWLKTETTMRSIDFGTGCPTLILYFRVESWPQSAAEVIRDSGSNGMACGERETMLCHWRVIGDNRRENQRLSKDFRAPSFSFS